MRRLTLVVLATALASIAPPAAAPASPAPAVREAPPAPRPNILLVVTDDQRYDTIRHMPKVDSLLGDHGIRFEQAFVPTALCCPSRTSILTGRYSHSTGIWSNDPPFGGFPAFDDSSTLATWLNPSYETALFGKYLNNYQLAPPPGYVPPGWDLWHAFAGKNGAYYDFTEVVADHGDAPTYVSYGHDPKDYSTQVFGRQAAAFLKEPRTEPFFLLFAPYAPHGPMTPAPRDVGTMSEAAGVRPAPSFNEPDVSDKPAWLQALPRLGKEKARRMDTQRRRALETLRSVDRTVGRFVRILEDQGQLQDTLIIYLSDNGTLFGEHRLRWKAVAYEEAIRVPMIVRYDRITAGGTRNLSDLVLNVDVAPTIAEAAGVVPDVPPDGDSLLPLLVGRPPWRTAFVLEHLEDGTDEHTNPTYCGVRTEGWKYLATAGGDEELYDLIADPYEVRNVAADPLLADRRTSLLTLAHQLCDPLPPDAGFTLPPMP